MSDNSVVIPSFPMPPSVNHLYATVGRRRIKSREYLAFERAAAVWAMTHQPQLHLARHITSRCTQGYILKLDQMFFFPRSAIFTKDNRPKRNDTSNRIKALHDALAALLYIDDCWFFAGTYDKASMTLATTMGNSPSLDKGFVDVRITLLARPFA